MNRVLVTGGAGFLGSNLCDRLIQEGNEVICVDNLYTGNKENIRHLLEHPNFEFIRHDVIQPLLFLRQRELVHFARFKQLYDYYKAKYNK